MKRQVLYFNSPLVIIGVVAALFLFSRGGGTQAGSVVLAESERPSLIAASGRAKPISEEVHLASEISGKLCAVPVEEESSARKGDTARLCVRVDTFIDVGK
jgi:hypothetical protein